jgi:hypothetical protein
VVCQWGHLLVLRLVETCPAVFPGSLARQSCPAVLPGSFARMSCPAVKHFQLGQACLDFFRLVSTWSNMNVMTIHSDLPGAARLRLRLRLRLRQGLRLRTDLFSLVTSSVNCKLSFQQKEEPFGLRLFSTLLPKLATLATVWLILKHPAHCPSKHRTNDFQ